MPSEFHLIDQFFSTAQPFQRADVAVNIGDDCALLNVPIGKTLAITTDTMVENSHFYPNIDPFDLGYKSVATNLSDLAAMGAQPAWVSLALTLPNVDEHWLGEFSRGLFSILNEYGVQLIGGDTTSGAVKSITITAQGFVESFTEKTPEKTTALLRQQAQIGDGIYVSGTLGDGLAGFYLLSEQQKSRKSAVNSAEEFLIRKNLHPIPRLALGQTLVKQQLSRCALDLSDGLIGDLGHILTASGAAQGKSFGAQINLDKLPCSQALISCYGRVEAEKLAVQGGEDYELCFTVSPEKEPLLALFTEQFQVPITKIGQVVERSAQEPAIAFFRQGKPVELQLSSFEHFK